MPVSARRGITKTARGNTRADVTLNNAIDAIDDSIPYLVASVTGINGKTAAETTLYTVPTGKRLIVTRVVIRATVADTVSGNPSISVGGNSTSYNDFFTNTSCALTAAGIYRNILDTAGDKTAYAAATVLKLKVNTGATATTLTLTLTAEVFGYLIDA